MEKTQAIRLLSRQRHDYANRLQVIKGYLELGKPDKALEYADRAARELARESRLFNSVPPEAVIPLYELYLWARARDIYLRVGELGKGDASVWGDPAGLTVLRRALEDIEAPEDDDDFEVWLDLAEGPEESVIRLRWTGLSGPAVREIVITR